MPIYSELWRLAWVFFYPSLAFTSNALAILGLRSTSLLLAGVVHRFVSLETGLSTVLMFIGAKMLLLDVSKMPTAVSLEMAVGILTLGIVASLIKTSRREPSIAS